MTGRHAVYTLIQCTPLLVEKAGVAPDVTFRITACKQERVQARYPLWIWNPWGRTHEVQNRSNQWLHKMDLGPDKKFKKKKKKSNRLLVWRAIIEMYLDPVSCQSATPFKIHLRGELSADNLRHVMRKHDPWIFSTFNGSHHFCCILSTIQMFLRNRTSLWNLDLKSVVAGNVLAVL